MMKRPSQKTINNIILKVKTNRKIIVTAIVGGIIAMIVGTWESKIAHQPITMLERGGYGEIEYQKTLTAKNQKGEEFEVTLPVPGQVYTQEETQVMFRKIKEQLEAGILGDNQSFKRIQNDMYLPTQLSEWPVRIEWSSDHPTILDWEGKIGKEVDENGEIVYLTAEIIYQEEVTYERWELEVFPKILSDKETRQQKLLAAAAAENVDKSTEMYKLPTEINGEKIAWFLFQDSKSAVIVIMTLVLVGVMLLGNKREEFNKQQMRKAQMQIDYPEILSKLILLMNAGMSMRMSFAKVAVDYKKQKESSKRKNYCRYAYEEFWTTYQEMEHGVFETDAYEHLGTRCGLAIYKVFSVLLIQNLKKGNQKLLEAMEREMTNAFEDRKRRAKIRGEQASTKLLLPMMLMLIIVFVLLLVPAFLSF